MKLIALAGSTLALSIFRVAAESPGEVVVQAATPTPQATAAHTPPPIKLQSDQIVVQAAGAPSQQIAPTGSATSNASKDASSSAAIPTNEQAPGKAQAIDPDSVVPKDKVIAFAKRIEEQQTQIEENQVKIDQQIADITLMVQQAYVFSRRASK